MTSEPNPTVVRLDAKPVRQQRERQRPAGMRRHPAMWSGPDGSSVIQIASAARKIGPHPNAVGQTDEQTPDRRNDLVQRVSAIAGFARRRILGDYPVDEFGFDPHINDAVVMPLLRILFRRWFRIEVSGIENLPETGAALVVANHAGVLPLDGLMASVAVHDNHPARRALRLLAADLVFANPFLGRAARTAGHTLACPADAHRLLANGELTAVFPEGYKGLGKRFKDRYKLQRFGRGGFVLAALRTKAPIVPCSIVGSEETYPMIGDFKLLARLFGLPYFPITPLFPLAGPVGIIPLPSKWHIQFGEPISTAHYDDAALEDPIVTFELADHVRENIQQTLYRLLMRRRNTFIS